jgi:diguanylate cyclase (GGDEF)-like protein
MFLDLDRFKYINDTLGHNVGDEFLKTIAGRLKRCVRAEDTVARLGGDEFTVVMTEVFHAEDAGLIADKIVKTIRKPVTVSGETIATSVSVGISIFPDDANDSEEMLKTADAAMYHAKTRGKNNFQFFTAELASRTLEHALIDKGLRCALESDEFELFYQPQVSMVDGKIAGVEALIRWNHPEHGQLLPDTFIHVADDSNLIDDISEWVLRTALRDYKSWLNNGSMGPRIAVNITGRQITRKRSVKRILNILEELAPEPNTLQLDLEITETALEDTERTIDIINALRRRGVMFAIDDFGTGHSSLSRLKQLPIDSLKIDRSFIQDIADEGDDKAIAAAIIAMAHSLGLRVIGEGVETKLQLDVLRTLDCDEIQGFYFSKPVPSNEIVRLLDIPFQ